MSTLKARKGKASTLHAQPAPTLPSLLPVGSLLTLETKHGSPLARPTGSTDTWFPWSGAARVEGLQENGPQRGVSLSSTSLGHLLKCHVCANKSNGKPLTRLPLKLPVIT